MRKSSRKASVRKPAKPHKDFPLFPHAVGQWAKKVRGKTRYFGPWHNPEAALQLWTAQKDDLLAGREPRLRTAEGFTLAALANHYLTSKQRKRDAGEITARTFADCRRATDRIIDAFGRERFATDLTPEDFGRLRASMAKNLKALALGIEIQRIRSVFLFGVENGLFPGPVRYGQEFDKPSKQTIRKQRLADGSRTFEAADLRRILDAAPVQMKAMILLGVNAALGNHDVAMLPLDALNLETGWLVYARRKTGMPRRCPLWPETVQAVADAIAARPEPKNREWFNLVFLTRNRVPWVKHAAGEKGSWTDSVGLAFGKLLRSLDLKRPGYSYYSLRHTFRTVADDAKDQPAADAVMGHVPDTDDMPSNYRDRTKISDQRLRAVVGTVRTWLFGDAVAPAGSDPARPALKIATGT